MSTTTHALPHPHPIPPHLTRHNAVGKPRRPAGDPVALAEALGRLIEDGSLRRCLGESGRARVAAMCDPQRQIEALAQTIASLVNRRCSAVDVR